VDVQNVNNCVNEQSPQTFRSYDKNCSVGTDKLVHAVTFVARVQDGRGANVGRNTDYFD
jgi:hypothetical protein